MPKFKVDVVSLRIGAMCVWGFSLKIPSCREFSWQKMRVYKLEERGNGTSVTCTVPYGCTTSFLLHPTTYGTSNQSGDI
jgi:hypothetical protein